MWRIILYLIILLILFLITYKILTKISFIIDKIDAQYKQRYEKAYSNNKNKYQTKEDINKKIYSEYQKTTNNNKKETKELPNCLTVLGFTSFPKSLDDVKNRYKKLVKIYHPDSGGTEEEFNRINEAYKEALLLNYKKQI